jgi:hypothetical protein
MPASRIVSAWGAFAYVIGGAKSCFIPTEASVPKRLANFLPILLFVCIPFSAQADSADIGAQLIRVRDNGQYANVDPDIKRWVESLTDHNGVGCCATADGIPLQEPDWEMDASGYRVKIDGNWHPVPDRAVVNEANRLGHAVVWFYWQNQQNSDATTDGAAADAGPKLHIRCFLPGTAT